MSIESRVFERAQIDFDKLEDFGFVKSGDAFLYQTKFMNGDFLAKVKVDGEGKVSGEVYDTNSNEVYVLLRVEGMNVGFAGQVRQEYEKILDDIKQHCSLKEYFIFPQSNRLTEAIRKCYGDVPLFMWEKFAGYGVFKIQNSGKWYAFIGNLDFSKLDKNRTGEVEIINLKADAEQISLLTVQRGFYPAYHMNKKNWITIVLDETIDDEVILSLIDDSRYLVTKNKKKID